MDCATKDAIRSVHEAQRAEPFQENDQFLKHRAPDLLKEFPNAINPRLQLIEADSWESDLFRMASLLWSSLTQLWRTASVDKQLCDKGTFNQATGFTHNPGCFVLPRTGGDPKHGRSGSEVYFGRA